ncbi:MAG: hypothetical protein Q8S00_26440 [Deltaproteobacteria bacterium]|nr:hypothetical protein [Deltaproteobacteria bacterium]
MSDKKLPVLLARPHKGGWRAWCPFCAVYHTHSPEPGHRAAHCADGPFKDRGYTLRLDPDFKKRIQAAR